MRDQKKILDLGGDNNWPEVPSVFISGDQAAQPWQKEGEGAIIESWQRVAVLRVTCPHQSHNPVPSFFIGFQHGTTTKLLRHAITTPAGHGQDVRLIGMRVGDGDVRYWIMPSHPMNLDHLAVELVEITSIDDPQYEDLQVF